VIEACLAAGVQLQGPGLAIGYLGGAGPPKRRSMRRNRTCRAPSEADSLEITIA
jgi:hypothetical protein